MLVPLFLGLTFGFGLGLLVGRMLGIREARYVLRFHEGLARFHGQQGAAFTLARVRRLLTGERE